MFENVWFVAAAWMALALVASLISIWTGISVALIEILVGVVAGNFLHLQAIHHPGDGGDPECLHPHSYRPEVLSTHTKNDAGLGAPLSAQRDFPVSA